MNVNQQRQKILSKPVLAKGDLTRFFGMSRVWVRRYIFTNEVIEEIGLDVNIYLKRKVFTIRESNIIKQYLIQSTQQNNVA